MDCVDAVLVESNLESVWGKGLVGEYKLASFP
jgi:hypothetical protein